MNAESLPALEKKWIATGELTAAEMAILQQARTSTDDRTREASRVLLGAIAGQYHGEPDVSRIMCARTAARFEEKLVRLPRKHEPTSPGKEDLPGANL